MSPPKMSTLKIRIFCVTYFFGFLFFLLLFAYLFLEVFQLIMLLGKVLVHFLKCSVLNTLTGVF